MSGTACFLHVNLRFITMVFFVGCNSGSCLEKYVGQQRKAKAIPAPDNGIRGR